MLQFRRLPKLPGIVFERIELEPEMAYFRACEGDYTYFFTLDREGQMHDGFREHSDLDRGAVFVDHDEDDEVGKKLASLVKGAIPVAAEQFATWDGLNKPERVRLMITWGEDQLNKAETVLRELVNSEPPRDNTEEVMLLCKDLEVYEQYLAGLYSSLQV